MPSNPTASGTTVTKTAGQIGQWAFVAGPEGSTSTIGFNAIELARRVQSERDIDSQCRNVRQPSAGYFRSIDKRRLGHMRC